MQSKSIWLPIIGDGSDENPYRPDVPPTVSWSSDDGIPTNLGDKGRGHPLGKHANIIVAEADVGKCTKRILDKDVLERDRLIVDMLRMCRGDYDAKTDSFFDAIPGISSANEARRRAVKDVLIQAVLRGLSASKAEAIRQRLNLPIAHEKLHGL